MDQVNPDAIELGFQAGLAVGEAPPDVQTLPRADGGRDAWITLGGIFVLEALIWALPFSYGIFQTYYSTHEPFEKQPAGIAAISTTAIAIMLFASPLVAVLMQRYPRARIALGLAGLAIMDVALITASCSNSTTLLLASQGVLYAIGGVILYFPAMYVIDEWFIDRKGLAFGICWTATGSASAVIPFLLQWLLDNYGFRTTLRTWSIILTAGALPSIFLIKNRYPTTGARSLRPIDATFLTRAPFWTYHIPSSIQSIAYFLPGLWIPSFAAAMKFSDFAGPLALSLLNLFTCGGLMLQGRLVDRFHPTVAIFVATVGAIIAVFIFWGFARTEAMLYIFAIMWGLTGGGYPANWSGCAKSMQRSSPNLSVGFVISLMCAGKGIASVVSGPLSQQLLRLTLSYDTSSAYGSEYGAVIVFTGIGVTLGGGACVARMMINI